MPHVLIVDDDVNATAMLAEIVAAEGFTTMTAGTLQEARMKMAIRAPDVILLDLVLPDGNGIDLFEHIGARATTEIVLITGHASLETSIEALRLGAADYLVKPIDLPQLRGILSRLTRPAELKEEILGLRSELRSLGRFGRLIGVSQPMQEIYDQIGRVAPTRVSVLVTGESGTGKELVAQTLHDLSRRRKQPFLAVNCGAISPQLMESEMFGHEKGSFTGANRQHRGIFEQAHGGTLFLDEVTEMPLDLQVKLLRVLESGTFTRVGSDQLQSTDVRIVAATNRVPAEAVAQGKLREDLFYRLQVFPIHLPPLRERVEDVEALASHFLGHMNEAESTQKTFVPEAIDALRAYHWPGNVREVRNVVQRAFIMAEDVIDASCLPLGLTPAPRDSGPFLNVRVGSRISDVERRLILATLEQCDGVREKAADMLGISVKTLYNRLTEYRLLSTPADMP